VTVTRSSWARRPALRGLTREDFTLSEDGKLQEIVSFEAFDGAEVAEGRPPPVAGGFEQPAQQDRAGAFVLLVDDLGIDARRLPRLLKALSECCRAPSARETR
jgi:hypothetical protein